MGLNLSRDWCSLCDVHVLKQSCATRVAVSHHYPRTSVSGAAVYSYRTLVSIVCLPPVYSDIDCTQLLAISQRTAREDAIIPALSSPNFSRSAEEDAAVVTRSIKYTYLSRLAWKIWRPNHLDCPSLTWWPNDRKRPSREFQRSSYFPCFPSYLPAVFTTERALNSPSLFENCHPSVRGLRGINAPTIPRRQWLILGKVTQMIKDVCL